jgi:hypothetical protein
MTRHSAALSALVVLPLTLGGLTTASGAVDNGTSTIVSVDPEQRSARQSAKLQMHPQIAASGPALQPAGAAKSAMTATFKPRKVKRPVTLQRKSGSRWVNKSKGRQNRKGVAEFTGAYAKGRATYRVVAPRYRGLKPVKSAGVVTSKPGAADFTDDFAAGLDPATWATRGDDYQPTSKRTCSRPSADATRVSGGVAKLRVLVDPDPPGALPRRCSYDGELYKWRLNGHIGTQNTYSFKYGYAAARIKFQARQGQHGSFWMNPATQVTTLGSASSTGAEIDVIEWFGERARRGGLYSFLHHWPDDEATPVKVGGAIPNPARYGKDWAGRYHVFSVEWTPSRYVFRIDGQETFRTSKAVSGQEQYLILSLLSSDYELENLGNENKLPQTMSVDWVRTWER